MIIRIVMLLSVAAISSFAEPGTVQTNKSAAPAATGAQQAADAGKSAQLAEQVRTHCIEGRRYVAGRVLQVLPEGLIVDSGYSQLLSPPLNRSWLVSSTVSINRNASAVEEIKPDAVCVGVVLLSDYPKRPAVKAYDYVVMHAYPAGEFAYTPVQGVHKNIRRFSASLARAVEFSMERESK
jgi:hypothetical protein